MLRLIGLGIGEDEISLRGLDVLEKAEAIYVELYTSKWEGLKRIEKISGRKIPEIQREDLEELQEKILEEASQKDVCLLIPGDPLSATTHIDLIMECKKRDIETEIIHASSIFSAVAETGLQLYKFGRTVTIPYPEEGYNPKSFMDYIKENQKNGLHTLCLLDVKPKKSMEVKEALEILNFSPVIGAHFGKETVIKYGPKESLKKQKIPTPAVVVIPGHLHPMEKEMLEFYKI